MVDYTTVPEWSFRDVSGQSSDYGDVTQYVFEHDQYSASVRIAPSEGGTIMICPRGSWQVSLPRIDEFIDLWDVEHHCFETEDEALSFAVEWLESLETE